MRHALVLLSMLYAGPAFAADDDADLFKETDPSKGNNAQIPDETTFKDEDDLGIPSFAQVEPPVAVASKKMPLDVTGKQILADNWGAQVVVVDTDAVVIELPVLYAHNRGEYDGVGYWLVAEAVAGGKKVAETRVLVAADAIAVKGPSIQFFRLFAPVPTAAGVIVVNVSRAALASPELTLLFTRSVDYKL